MHCAQIIQFFNNGLQSETYSRENVPEQQKMFSKSPQFYSNGFNKEEIYGKVKLFIYKAFLTPPEYWLRLLSTFNFAA